MADNVYIIQEIASGLHQVDLKGNIHGGNDALDFSSKVLSLTNTDAKCLICNLKEVQLMNSSGLGMLVSGLNTLKKSNINMVLVNLPDKIKRLLEMTHLNQVFKIYEDVEQARKDYK